MRIACEYGPTAPAAASAEMSQAVTELDLDNVEVVQARMQEYQPARAFDMVISRAVASLDLLYRQSAHLLAPGGRQMRVERNCGLCARRRTAALRASAGTGSGGRTAPALAG